MRSLKSRLHVLAVLSVACGLIACSSDDGGLGNTDGADASSAPDGGAHAGDAASATDATTAVDGAHADTGIGGGEAGSADASDGAVDSGYPDAGDAGDSSNADAGDSSAVDASDAAAAVDAADAALPPPGSACAPTNSIQQQPCGLCGTQERVCLPDSTGTGAVWQPWGFCQNEPVGACQPGTQGTEACGNCGHRAHVCQIDCSWAVGACLGQPVDACVAGDTKFEFGLSCNAGSGRTETCQSDCTWGTFGACTTPDYGAPIAISATVGATVTGVRKITSSPSHGRLTGGACPTTLETSTNAYTYVLVQNNTNQAAKVSIYFSQAPGGEDIDTEIAIYPGSAVPPLTDSARMACLDIPTSTGDPNYMDVTDYCFPSEDTPPPDECQGSWGGLIADDYDGDNSVPIGAHASVWVYAGATEDVTSSEPHAGNFQINLRTESLQ